MPTSKTKTSKASARRAAKRPPAGASASAALWRDLKERLEAIDDLSHAAAVLSWDQSTYMPPGGAAARGRQMARLNEIAHEQRTDPALGHLLDRLEPVGRDLDPDSDDAALLRVLRRDFDRAIRVPASFVGRANAAASASYQAWTAARPASDFAAMRPHLERALELSREYAGFFPGADHIMDPLIGPDEGVTVATTRKLFADLRARLLPLVDAITATPVADDSCLRRHFPEPAQLDFAMRIARDFGYDLARGRLDKTAHPFMTAFTRNDVRITTRINEHDLSDALFSTLHETGHALYEQGIAASLVGPLAGGTSAGVHESQSRLWENIIARSRPFWEHYYPQAQKTFPEQLGKVPLDAFYRAINKVERSLIRTDADEVTYNLHVMIRFELEAMLLEGRLAVRDLADAWNARYRSDLGLEPPDHRDGVLQDVHWYGGGLGGAFQSYTIGNILSAQFYAAALGAAPSIPGETAAGRFATLLGWLTDHVYRHGRKLGVDELTRRATGAPMQIEPYVRYLTTKYAALYDLDAYH